ncbi:MAG: excinuclease ABC subunit UvrC [Candidatus Omnitrophica bacterium]|nr:excinuclease ABC subunit UvrC [Candidatus Omnitrophota bacterium]
MVMIKEEFLGSPTLQEELYSLPETPGVYLMKGKGGEKLYIGKAQNLRKRVLSYFQKNVHSPKITVLIQKVRHVEVIETQTEADALLLEASLIKRYQCRYNTMLRDDKTYPLLKLTGDAYPRLHITRNRTDRKATYYGPYTDAKLLREVVRIVNNLFPIRKCERLPKTACLYYHIGQCLAPCIKPEVKPAYNRYVKEIKSFLGGGKKSLIDYLTDRMHEARKEYHFEDAQFFKEQIEALSWLRKKRFDQKIPEGGIGLRGTLSLKKLFGMERLPERIVCFDVSNIQGNQSVASKVSFFRELENKLEYRRYKIKTVSGINDYAMIQEALRRMLRGLREGTEGIAPDLIVIDGGRGHLNAALEVLQSEGFGEIKLISIAKQFEYLFSPDCQEPIAISHREPSLRLLQRIRDEAHRFVITYHRFLKAKELTHSILDQITGIGEKRKRALLTYFPSITALRNATVDEVAHAANVNETFAKKILAQIQALDSSNVKT